MSVSLLRIGDVRLRAGDAAGAMAAYAEGLDIHRALAEKDPDNTQWQTDVVVSLWKLSQLEQGTTGRGYLEEALSILERLSSQRLLSADQQGWIEILKEARNQP